MRFLLFFLTITLSLFSCSSDPKGKQENSKAPRKPTIFVGDGPIILGGEKLLPVDLKQDLSNKSLQELRLLRTALYARQGYLFMEADLRGYYTSTTVWYDSLMEARFWAEDSLDKRLQPVQFTLQEQAFLDKIKGLETQKQAQNYVMKNGRKLANIDNVLNFFQFKSFPAGFQQKLKENNFVIIPNDNLQLFHVYEQNDYNQLPNFVTTDLYLQLYHMYFSYLLKSLEQDKFIPLLTELTDGLFEESMKVAKSTSDPKQKKLAQQMATFYAIPYYLLTGGKQSLPASYHDLFDDEIDKILAEEDAPSEFLDFKEAAFPYSLFKPRSHYTRSEPGKRYFRAMMWLQTAPFCREKTEQLEQASFNALVLMGKSRQGKPLIDLYQSVFQPIAFLIGEPDNLSVMDIYSWMQKNKVTQLAQLLQPATQEKINAEMISIVSKRNKIKPKIAVSCPDKINFMPQRYLIDNEILQELVDVKENAKRAFPKGLDVFAVFGNASAEKILFDTYKESNNWDKYAATLNQLKSKLGNYQGWDQSVYTKWIESLVALQQKDPQYPPFMQTFEWDKKNLNTSLASWAELKHDSNLYGEQPDAAECGGAGPPPPITLGYVEPNVRFWQKIVELNNLTASLLKKHQLLTEDITAKNRDMQENAAFLLSASQKEIKGEQLSEQEYQTIEIIGSTAEYLSLSIIEPGKSFSDWENVQGPDKSVAVVADIYTRNISGCQKNGILHVGTGKVNDLYVVVQIEGALYLTKGAVFSYYEFEQPLGQRLTDEEWQKMLDDNQAPALPDWMKDIILPTKDKPVPDEKIFYSSGC
ncbi:MAG: DUF3160 domain-containing protein [Bacteroidota bacterium]